MTNSTIGINQEDSNKLTAWWRQESDRCYEVIDEAFKSSQDHAYELGYVRARGDLQRICRARNLLQTALKMAFEESQKGLDLHNKPLVSHAWHNLAHEALKSSESEEDPVSELRRMGSVIYTDVSIANAEIVNLQKQLEQSQQMARQRHKRATAYADRCLDVGDAARAIIRNWQAGQPLTSELVSDLQMALETK